MAENLHQATPWLQGHHETREMHVNYSFSKLWGPFKKNIYMRGVLVVMFFC